MAGRVSPLFFRVAFYLLGLFFIACGSLSAVYATLGVTPVSALPYAVSLSTGLAFGTSMTVLFTLYVLLQLAWLGRDFKRINLLQVVFSIIFGFLVNVIKDGIGPLVVETMPGRVAVLCVGIFFTAFGLLFYLSANLVPLPPEGLVLVLAAKYGRAFSKMKIAFDILSVAAGCAVTLAALGYIGGIGVGTAVAAIATGKVLGLLSKPIRPKLERICFPVEHPVTSDQ